MGINKISFSLTAIIFSVFMMSTSALAFTITEIDAQPTIKPLPNAKIIQLNAGVYYDPQLSAYEHMRFHGTMANKALIGRDSVELFDALMPMVFKTAKRVNHLPPYSEGEYPDIDVVIAPAIEYFRFVTSEFSDKFSEKHRIDYRVVTYARNAYPIAINRIRGKADYKHKIGVSIYKHVDADLSAAASQFLTQFNNKVFVDQLYAAAMRHRAPSASMPATNIFFEANVTQVNVKLDRRVTANLNEAGIIPIKLSVTNKGSEPIRLDEALMRLELPKGQLIGPLATSAIFPEFDRYRYGGFAVDVIIPSEAIGFIADELIERAQEKADLKRQDVLLEKIDKSRIKPRSLESNQRVKGHIYFAPDKGTQDFESALLHIWLPTHNNLIQKKIPITKIGYRKIPIEPKYKSDDIDESEDTD